MSLFNAVAAFAILNSPNVSQDQKILGVGSAAVINGTLGLVAPALIAQQATSRGGGGGAAGGLVDVPDVSSAHPAADAATKTLQGDRLVAVLDDTSTFSNEVTKGLVISQDPPAGSRVPLDSTVTIVVSRGAPSPAVTEADLDTDLTNKIESAKTELEGKIDDARTELDGRLTSIEQKLDQALKSTGASQASRRSSQPSNG